MVAVTERAKRALLRRRRIADIRSAEVGLRLAYVSSGEVVLVPDHIRAGDQVVTHGGSTVLLVDADLAEGLLAGRTVDCREGAGGELALVVRATVTGLSDSVGDRRPGRANKRRGRSWPPPPGTGPSPPATAA